MSHENSQKAVASIYNSAVAASMISAAWELGIFDELRRAGSIDVRDLAENLRLDLSATLGLFRALAAVDIVEREDTKVRPAHNFAEAYRTRSFFHWLTRGSAELFRRMPELLYTANRTGDFYQRDSAAIAFACREMNTFCYDPWFWQAVEGIDFKLGLMADLGCGSGERIRQILRRYPGTRALGIDVARPALAAAGADAAEEGLADRVTLLEDNVITLRPRPEFADVELLTCFMMGHDFWPRQQCVDTLQNLRALFPKVRTFLLGDATRTVGVPDRDLPTFTLGFELAHDIMGTWIPTVNDWESVFDDGGWVLRKKYSINVAVSEVIFDLEPR
jgi:phenylpyruvate C(3)-methyltransferase